MTNDQRRRRRLRARRSRPRRGVLLLVVLSLLVLFLLVGTSFMLIGGQYRTASRAIETANRTTFQPADLLERALMQVVRDTRDRHSALRYHSLLRDLYGVDGFVGRVLVNGEAAFGAGTPGNVEFGGAVIRSEIAPVYAGVDPTAGAGLGATQGQFIEFYVPDVLTTTSGVVGTQSEFNVTSLELDEQGLPIEHQLSPTSGAYEGSLLTFLSGPCAGSTVRVVSYDHIVTEVTPLRTRVLTRFRTTLPRRRDGGALAFGPLPADTNETALTDLVESETLGVRFMVNGRPFNGAGVGFNPLAMAHDLDQGTPAARNSALERFDTNGPTGEQYGLELALTPNSTYYNESRNAHLNPSIPNAGTNPWAPGRLPGDFLSLTRGFAAGAESLHRTFAGLGDTDESYDAADYQNMALASQPLERRLRGRVLNATGALVDPDAFYASSPLGVPTHFDLDGVPIPSLHRPSLANFWFHRLFNSSWLTTEIVDPTERARFIIQPYIDGAVRADVALAGGQPASDVAARVTAIKRKFMMRPLREDHPGFDGSNPLSRYASNALRGALTGAPLVNPRDPANSLDDEITFPYWEAVGPWDVDNDGDGVPDSVWVDLGLPVQQTEDGRFYKPLVAILVEDLDGRLNLNAHGSAAELAITEDLDQSAGVVGNLAQDFVNGSALVSSNQLPNGEGWGVADISLRPILSPTLPLDELLGGFTGPNRPAGNPLDFGYTGNPQYDDYARVMFGRPDPRDATFLRRDAAPALREQTTFGRYGSAAGSTTPLRLTGPGVSFQPDPVQTALFRDEATQQDFLGLPSFENRAIQALNGFTSPPDLRGRYATGGLVATGSAVDEPIDEARARGALSWRDVLVDDPSTLPPINEIVPANTVDDSPYELNLSPAARRLAPTSLSAVQQSYLTTSPISDDAPFSPAELERVLRAFDADADTLPDRLWRTIDAVDPAKLAAATDLNARIADVSLDNNNEDFVANSLQSIVAAARAAINRRQLTTDSWDLPTPNENWTERLILGADGLPGIPWSDTNLDSVRSLGDAGDDDSDGRLDEGDEAITVFDPSGSHTFSNNAVVSYDAMGLAGCDDYVVVMRDTPPSPGRITDYLRYRVVLELKQQGLFLPAVPHTDPVLSEAVDNIIFGDNSIPAQDPRLQNTRYSFGGLLAPELLAGLRMDLNRPLGDGRDNNNNGIVDEAAEAAEPYTFSVVGGELQVGGFQDRNANGVLDQDLDGDGVLYIDTDSDGVPDRFDPGDLILLDRDGNGTINASDGEPEPIVDHVWIDDNGDGLRDPNEFRPFDYTRGGDVNGRGGLVNANVGVRDDGEMARQLFARHLYVLMLLLTDENYLAPYDPHDPQVRHYIDPESGEYDSATGALFTPGIGPKIPDPGYASRVAIERFQVEFATEIAAGSVTNSPFVPLTGVSSAAEVRRLGVLNAARQDALRKLTRRKIAQWVINVVDFRDPDAIQTPFEYDENPWDGWNVVDTQGTTTPADDIVRPLDGDLTTDESYLQRRVVSAAGVSPPDPVYTAIVPDAVLLTDRTRGVVWGAERPEVLLTEGVAWHNRKLEDADSDPVNVPPGTPAPDDGDGLQDDDLDQMRLPTGSLFVEAFNPWVSDAQEPAELYSHVDRNGVVSRNQRGVRLDRLSNVAADPANPRATRSPVWRFTVVEEHPLIRNSTFNPPAGGLQQAFDDPEVQPGPLAPSANPNQYLGVPLAHSPWAYRSDLTLSAGTTATSPVIPLPEGYLDFRREHSTEALYAELTTRNEVFGIGGGRGLSSAVGLIRDADGIPLPVGVIERSPTLPDPSFPEFDRFAQPLDVASAELDISSVVDNNGARITRRVLEKPNRFIERAFYAAPATRAVTIRAGGLGPRNEPVNDLLRVDYRFPDLAYEVNVPNGGGGGITANRNERLAIGTPAGVNLDNRFFGRFRVSASKFANGIDRIDLANDGLNTYNFDAATLEVTPAGFSPLLPGRRGVIATTGDVIDARPPGPPVRPTPPFPTFDGPDAIDLERRYTTVFSEPASGAITVAPTFQRRLEMIPSDSPNNHQFAIRMNGLYESLAARSGSASFNLTVGTDRAASGSTAASIDPVIAIPIDHFSISEPVDQYVFRQIELDPAFAASPTPNVVERRNNNVPADTYFSQAVGTPFDRRPDAQRVHFDEPFDVLPELIENQTTPNYRSMHLERLANPLLPWNPPPVGANDRITPMGRDVSDVPFDQHDPNLPVNPYLPVDALSLDLTAFNGTASTQPPVGGGIAVNETSVASPSVPPENVNPNAPRLGPEQRHRRQRDRAGTVATPETAIGFTANERGRPTSPFPRMWLFEPARLLWRQARATAFVDLAHNESTSLNNGLTVKIADAFTGAGSLGRGGVSFDVGLLSPGNYSEHAVDFAWRMTLGFADFFEGEFHTGGALTWLTEPNADTAAQAININGDADVGDLVGRPEITISGNEFIDVQNASGAGTIASPNPNGVPDFADAFGVTSAANAQQFFEQYQAQNLVMNDSTTPAFHWPNRPLASAGELLQVPVWGGSRMLTYYSVFNWQRTQMPFFENRQQVNPYNGEAGSGFDHDGLDYDPRGGGAPAPFTFDGDFANDFNPAATMVQPTIPGPIPQRFAGRVLVVDQDGRPEEVPTNTLRWRETLGHFGHLMNFLQTARFPAYVFPIARTIDLGDNAAPGGTGDDADETEEYVVPQGAPHFYRLLDYVHTPSRFTATDTLLNQDTFSLPGLAPGDVREEYSAPFNRLANYREPGRVNLNTIAGRGDAAEPADRWSEVYDGLMHRVQDASLIDYNNGNGLLRMGHLGPAWRDVELSRRGYVQPEFDPRTNGGAAVDYSPGRLHPDFPTRFANPFRAPGEGANVPLVGMVQTGVDATLLRAHPLSPGADGAWGARGVDETTVDKSGVGGNGLDPNTGLPLPDSDGIRDDAGEAGVVTLEAGGATDNPAELTQSLADRLRADVVLARFQDSGARGRLPDTFMEDAFRISARDVNPRNITARQSLDPSDPLHQVIPTIGTGLNPPTQAVANSEISKRATPVPLFSGASLEPSLDTERNSTTRYQPIQRLSNLATTRSNVYAIWITVGFFEVTQAADNPRIAERYFTTDTNSDGSPNDFQSDALRELFFQVYPDGWTLGAELGFDTGTNRRHRGFYVVDRSLPVAFRPGEDLNVSDTVLVRRRIE